METNVPAAEEAQGETEPTESGPPEPTEAGLGGQEMVAAALPAGAAEETPTHLAQDGAQSVPEKDDGRVSCVEAAKGGRKEGPPSLSEASPLPAPPVPASCSPAEDAPKPRPSPASQPQAPDFYCVKWITWKGERTPVIMQSENGPCPLLAIMNILFLQWKVKLPAQKEVVTSDELMAYLGDCLLSIKPQDQAEAVQLNFQQNVNDAMTVLSKLSTGLDVNVRFTGVSDFEYTPECIVFDLLNVPLYHGWLVDPQGERFAPPQIPEVAGAVSKLSYNQLVEKIITCKHSSDPNLVTEEGELSVFFRNNHFSAMIKHKSHLYLLVTDQGFLNEDQVTWESLHNVDGDSCFCDAEFHLSHTLGKEAAGGSPVDQRQVDQQGAPAMSDLELAQQLQQEEYQQPPPLPSPLPSPAQGRSPPAPRPAGERRSRQKVDTDCTIL
ncbi:hypothetical protein E2320_014076 [Naja naja]|nr:hypothetical protein E2320_014076 [Naja naja]